MAGQKLSGKTALVSGSAGAASFLAGDLFRRHRRRSIRSFISRRASAMDSESCAEASSISSR